MNETDQAIRKLEELRTELRVGMQQLRTEIQQLRGDIFQQLQADQRWLIGLIIGVYATNIATLLAIIFKS